MKKISQIMLSVGALVVSVAGSAFAGGPVAPQVPEPGTMVLVGVGVAGLALYRKLKK